MAVLRMSLKGKGSKPPKALGLSAIGAYAYYRNQPSFFLYAVLDFPLGGPPYFFVTGLAAGFGYNRKLNVPPLEEIHAFPLVAQAMSEQSDMSTSNIGQQVSSQLEKLHQHISVTPGAGFLAIGVKFTSFKVLDCFALLTVAIHESLEVNLLGIATLAFPPNAGANKRQLAKITMHLKATLSLEKGELTVAAEIQEDDSYIIFPGSTLTGSAALYVGFAGDRDGDFVLTAGGYHPDFKVPSHYPQVKSRLGFKANVGPLSITGERYFALCTHAVMAGGRLEASCRIEGVEISFTLYAHFLISWKPFYYSIRAGVMVHAKWGRVSARARVSSRIWGPDFGGYAEARLFMLSLKIEFGDQSDRRPKAIGWDEFKDSFLPAAAEVCNIAVSQGLVKQIKNDSENIFIVNPKELELVTNSTIPIKQATKGEGAEVISTREANTTFGIRPMAVKGDNLSSTHTIKITRDGSDTTGKFDFKLVTKNVPSGLWSPDGHNSGDSTLNLPNANDKSFVENALSGFLIVPALQPPAGKTEDIEVSKLQHKVNKKENAYAWNNIAPFNGTSSEEGRETIKETIADNDTRNSLLTALGFTPGDDVSVTDSVAEHFVIAPQVK